MTRLAWLILAWGIVLLTIVDGVYSVRINSYAVNECAYSDKKCNNNSEHLDGPIFTVLIESFDAIEGVIDRHEKLLIVLSTIAIAWFTGTLWRATTDLQAIADRQSEETQDSIIQATRSANAMENVAESTRKNAFLMQNILHKQMRAYVAVDVGTAAYQDKTHNFAGIPSLINTGFTPARNVSFSATAAILNVDKILPQDLVIPDNGEMIINDAGIGPRQQFTIQGVVKRRFPENQIRGIMEGSKRRLFVWGIVTYDDVFGKHWITHFCHNHTFYLGPDNNIKVNSYYHCNHNDAT